MEKTTESLLNRVFSGGPEAMIALLMLILIVLGYVVKRIYDREVERSKEQSERIKDLEKQLTDLNKTYHDKLESVLDKYHENTRVQMESFNKVNETLTKIMIKLYGA